MPTMPALPDMHPVRLKRFYAVMIGAGTLHTALCIWNASREVGLYRFLELGTLALLVCCTIVTAHAFRQEQKRLAEMNRTLQSYAGGLTAIVGASFTTWHLTTAESDVALLALKGFETQEIASLRHSTAGTVRAQLARVYAKAGVESRSGLQGLFLEDLMSGLPVDSLEMATMVSGLRAAGGAAERRLDS